MENWQIDHISRNLPYLLANTRVSGTFLAEFSSQGLITSEEVELIKSKTLSSEKCASLYKILQTRADAFEALKDALESTRQSGVYRILDQCCGAANWRKFGSIEYDENQVLGSGCDNTEVYGGKLGKFRPSVAVKKIKCKKKTQESITKEIEILRMLPTHSNIVQFFHAEMVYNKFILIALELCNCTLHDCVEEKKYPLEKREILQQITTGLGFLHANKIIHRDLKPANVLLAISEMNIAMVKLSDFGLSKVIDQTRDSVTVTSFVGTKCWTAPETLRQLDDGSSGLQSSVTQTYSVDIFPLGCIFFYVLTDGKHPFESGVRCETNVLDGKYNLHSLKVHESNLKQYVDLIRSMIATDAKLRPSCQEILPRIIIKDAVTTIHVSNRMDVIHTSGSKTENYIADLTPDASRRQYDSMQNTNIPSNGSTNTTPKLDTKQKYSDPIQSSLSATRDIDIVNAQLLNICKGNGGKPEYEVSETKNVTKTVGEQQKQKCDFNNFGWTAVTDDERYLQESFLKSGAYSSFGMTPPNPYRRNYMLISNQFDLEKRWFPQNTRKLSNYFDKSLHVCSSVWKHSDKCNLKIVRVGFGIKCGSFRNSVESFLAAETNDETSIFLMIFHASIYEPYLVDLNHALKSTRKNIQGYFLFDRWDHGYSLQHDLDEYQNCTRCILGDDVPIQSISCMDDTSLNLAQGIENVLLNTHKAILANSSNPENKQFQLLSLLKWGRPIDNFEPLTERRSSK